MMASRQQAGDGLAGVVNGMLVLLLVNLFSFSQFHQSTRLLLVELSDLVPALLALQAHGLIFVLPNTMNFGTKLFI